MARDNVVKLIDKCQRFSRTIVARMGQAVFDDGLKAARIMHLSDECLPRDGEVLRLRHQLIWEPRIASAGAIRAARMAGQSTAS